MARRKSDDERPRGRSSRSSHTQHQPGRGAPPPHQQPPHQPPGPPPQGYPPQQYPPPNYPPPTYPPPSYPPPEQPSRSPGYAPQRYQQAPDPQYFDERYQPASEQPTTRLPPADGQSYGPARYHVPPPGQPATGNPPTQPYPAGGQFGLPGKVDPEKQQTVTRAVVTRSGQLARTVTNKVITASKADGADESGLTALIWNQVLSYGTDAMITVALAGTVFFGASANAQRGNVLLYLLVTMAPFAVVAPIIGPALDRLQHGRRWAMGATGVGRAILAILMAMHSTDLLVLYPCALGSLVLSKAYSVIRAAAAPRLVPPGMTLVEANARLSIFGLASALIGGAIVGIVIKVTGSYTVGLLLTAIAFGACAYFAIRLPKQVDSASPVAREPAKPKPQRASGEPLPSRAFRLGDWAKRGFAPQVITAMQGESTLRFLSGLLTIFLAFYVEKTHHGSAAAFALGGIALGAGAGNFVGTGIGTRLKLARPERIILIGCAIGAFACLVTAILYSVMFAVLCMFISAVVNSLSKIALDAVIQRDVIETMRTGAFARSETFLQLAWVLGAVIGVVLPSSDGALGFWVAFGIVGAITVVIALRNRAMRRATGGRAAPTGRPDGSVA